MVDVNGSDEEGCTALHYGCQQKDTAMILLDAGADPCALCKGLMAWELCEDQQLASVLKQASENMSHNRDYSNKAQEDSRDRRIDEVNPVAQGHPKLSTIEAQQGAKFHSERAALNGSVQEKSLIYRGPLND